MPATADRHLIVRQSAFCWHCHLSPAGCVTELSNLRRGASAMSDVLRVEEAGLMPSNED
jgi:hypothetical protein